MNSKRRAELQRKLSMGAVPRPPAGLAERIKADIPKYLKAESEQRISRSVAFSMRIAASLLLLITSVLVTMHVLEPDQAKKRARSPKVQLDKAILRMPQTSTATTATTTAAAEEVRLEISEKSELPPRLVAGQRTRALEVTATTSSAERRESGDDRNAMTFDEVAELAVAPQRETPAVAEALSLPPPSPEPAPAPAPAAAVARRITGAASAPLSASAPSLTKDAFADELDLDAKKSVFGISLDPDNFQHIKASLEGGARPEGRGVNVEALVNYFAGAPARPPKRGVRLEVEASPAPIEAEGDRAVLRFTIDTPAIDVPKGGSVPPAVKDARIQVDIDRTAVASYRRIGEGDRIASEPVLLHNMSVTGLYELELRPHLRASQRVATVRLRYRSITDDREKTIEHAIHGRDLAKEWARASRRHRLAALGAVWGESLKDSGRRIEVARRAEELATQNPRDQLARELANAASATGDGER